MGQTLPVILTFALYTLLVLGVGIYATKFTKTMEDFFLAGRRLGAWVTAISSVASSESGWVVLGLVGIAYKEGLSAVWIAPGCLLGYVANWYLLAFRLRRESKGLGALTVSDFLEAKANDSSRLVRMVAVVITFFCMMGYVGAQFNAAGKTFDAVFKISYSNGVLLGAVITIVYTLLGGFRAVSWTDLIQGLMMVFGLIFLPVLAVIHLGGLGNLFQGLAQQSPSLLILSGDKAGFALFGLIIGYLGIGLGYPGQPHVVTRYMAVRGEREIRRSRLIAITWGILVYYGAIFLGLAGRLILPQIADPEYTYPTVALRLLPPVLAGIMLAAITSAIRSTADSQLLVAASAVARDVYQRVFQREASQKRLVLISRLTVLLLGLLAFILAMTRSRVVFWFVLFAWSGLGASFGPPILFSLYWKRTNKWGIVAGMIVGFATTVVWKLTGLSSRTVYELVPAFFFSALAVVIGSLFTKGKVRPSEV